MNSLFYFFNIDNEKRFNEYSRCVSISQEKETIQHFYKDTLYMGHWDISNAKINTLIKHVLKTPIFLIFKKSPSINLPKMKDTNIISFCCIACVSESWGNRGIRKK